MKARTLAVALFCAACGDSEPAADMQQALDAVDEVHQRLCATTDRCYPELQSATACVFPAPLGQWGLERAGTKDSACVRTVLEAHAKEAVASLECLAATEDVLATCAKDCPNQAEFDACVEAASPVPITQCSEPFDKVITREEADMLKACAREDE